MIEFYFKLFSTFILSGVVFSIMMKFQENKEKEAALKAETLMRSKNTKNYVSNKES